LYNWYAVAEIKGLCPSGWHVSSDAEWTTLINYLGGVAVAGGKMKTSGTTYWIGPNTGATNESGFSALPGGYRNSEGIFYDFRYKAFFWSTADSDTGDFALRQFNYDSNRETRLGSSILYTTFKSTGASIRCLKD
jgi:uncharacterized protein (TIGR02145 family)